MRVLITGADGFIGSALVRNLSQDANFELTLAVRSNNHGSSQAVIPVGFIDGETDWSKALQNQDVVIHTAALAHDVSGRIHPDLYKSTNFDGAKKLAIQAADAGVGRFVFISSIAVLGNISDTPFTEKNQPNPLSLAAKYKYLAEKELFRVSEAGSMDLVVIRPPLVYGPGARGNFESLVKLIRSGVPLPLGEINNKRSFIALENLVDFIKVCSSHPQARNEIFLISDCMDVSTTDFLSCTASAMGSRIRLFEVPTYLLKCAALLLGKRKMMDQLLYSMQIDCRKATERLSWSPPLSLRDGLSKCFIEE